MAHLYFPNEFNVTGARTALAKLKGKFEYTPDMTVKAFEDTLSKLFFAMHTYEHGPQRKVTTAVSEVTGKPGVLGSLKLTLKPKKRDALYVDDMALSVHIPAGPAMFDTLIDDIAAWLDRYEYFRRLQVNLDAYNDVVTAVCEQNGIPFTVRFSLGSPIVSATDDEAIFGLTEEAARNMTNIGLFDTTYEPRIQGYKDSLLDLLLQISKPYELIKLKSPILRALGVYSRRSLHRLMRDSVNRRLMYTRTGLGYVLAEDYFAVVQKIPVTEEELSLIDTESGIVEENTTASAEERERKQTHIHISFRVSPFNRETGEAEDVSLEQVLADATNKEVVEKAESKADKQAETEEKAEAAEQNEAAV